MGAQVAETTLNLDRIMDEGMAKFQGELIEAAREGTGVGGQESGTRIPESGVITPKPGETVSPPEGQESGVGGQESDVESRVLEAAHTEDKGPKTEEAGAQEGKTPETKEEKQQFRFKDHAAAEDGYRHLQAAKTKAEQEAARLRDELKTAKEAEERRQTQEKFDQDLTTFIADQHEKALTVIDTLDPDAEDYRKRVAKAWAEKDAAVEVWKRTNRQESLPKDQRSEAGGQRPEVSGQGMDPSAVWATVEQRAVASGIDASDDYFRMVCAQAPTQQADGTPMTFDEQVQWAVDKTLTYHHKQDQLFQDRLKAEAKKRADQDQSAALPLGKSPADRSAGKSQASKVVTLNDALDAAMEERRL